MINDWVKLSKCLSFEPEHWANRALIKHGAAWCLDSCACRSIMHVVVVRSKVKMRYIQGETFQKNPF